MSRNELAWFDSIRRASSVSGLLTAMIARCHTRTGTIADGGPTEVAPKGIGESSVSSGCRAPWLLQKAEDRDLKQASRGSRLSGSASAAVWAPRRETARRC